MQNNPNADTLKELRQVNAKSKGLELPVGSNEELDAAPPEEPAHEELGVEQEQEKPEVEEAAPEAPAAPAEDEEIKIGDRVFKSASEAIKYAEELDREKLLNEARNEGIREALLSRESHQAQSQPQEPPADDFDTEFYTNPKEALRKVREGAIQEAESRLERKLVAERQWNDFQNEYPDIRRKDAERILRENGDTVGKMTDIAKAKKLLAQLVRQDYAELEEIRKPKVELPAAKGTQAARSGGSPASVTPRKKTTLH